VGHNLEIRHGNEKPLRRFSLPERFSSLYCISQSDAILNRSTPFLFDTTQPNEQNYVGFFLFKFSLLPTKKCLCLPKTKRRMFQRWCVDREMGKRGRDFRQRNKIISLNNSIVQPVDESYYD
jgi:hypothetical protein